MNLAALLAGVIDRNRGEEQGLEDPKLYLIRSAPHACARCMIGGEMSTNTDRRERATLPSLQASSKPLGVIHRSRIAFSYREMVQQYKSDKFLQRY